MPKKLTWHDAGTKEFEGGISDVILFPMSNGVYGNGVAWNGVTAISENPSGADVTKLYADDEEYASLQAAERFACTIEAYISPEEFNECDGNKPGTDGVYLGQQVRKAFGLFYKTKIGDESHAGMDKGYKYHFVYNCTASPSSKSYTTINENPDAPTKSWEVNATPIKVNATGFKNTSTVVIDSTKVAQAKQANLETLLGIIYGSTTADSSMLTPDEIISYIETGAAPVGG